MIRYLKNEEFFFCRPLWQEAFPEDSREFLEYYFNKKIKNSRILVKEDEKGRVITMAHLNPYRVNVGKKLWKLDYIVGVATAKDCRHQGHMRDVLIHMLTDMNKEKKPFCYLMPASPAIYTPFGFRYIFDQPRWKMSPIGERTLTRRVYSAEGKERLFLAAWLNRWLAARFQVYAVRDLEYMGLLQEELESEDGCLYGWYDEQDVLKAVQAVWGLKKKEQRFLYSSQELWVEPEDKNRFLRPAIMARITDVQSFMEAIVLRSDCPCHGMDVMLYIRDSLIPAQNGLWRWRLNRNGSSLTKRESGLARRFEEKTEGEKVKAASIEEEVPYSGTLDSTEVLEITIEDLASWLFGYMRLEDREDEDKPPFWCSYIQPLEGVFLDEVV